MASADIVLSAPDVQALPADYDLAPAAEIMPLAVRATWDGSGAGGAFVPALEIVAPGGMVVATCLAPVELAAGESARVTFAPAMGGGSASSTTLPQLSAPVSVAATAIIVPAVAGSRIRVTSVGLMADNTVGVSFTGGSTLTGVYPLAPNTGFVLGPKPEGQWWFETDASAALTIVLSVAANVGGVLTYELA